MRISTSWSQQMGVNAMLDQQSKVNKTQMQLSTGKKILTPSDDPTASVRIIDFNQSIKQMEQYQGNINTARQRLNLEGGVLQNTTTLLQRINELGVQGLNDTNSQSDRIAIAVEMEGLNQQLIGLANTRGANGEYLFSGFKSTTQPFSKMVGNIVAGATMTAAIQTGAITINGVPTASITTTATGAGSRALVVSAINAISAQTGVTATDTNSDIDGVRLEAADGRDIAAQFTGTLDTASTGVLAAAVAEEKPLVYVRAYIYGGDANQRPIQIDSNRQIADGDPGTDIFGIPTVPLPATAPTPGSITNVFEAIDKFATDLRANTPNSASLNDISSALDKILAIQSSVGTRLNVLDNQEGSNEDYMLNTKSVLSTTEDLDYMEAISRFNQQTASLQAAQQAFSQVKKLSLFNYL